MSALSRIRHHFFPSPARWAPALLGAALVALSLSPPLSAICGAMTKPCRVDLECCPGLVCGPTRTCVQGCRVAGLFYRPGTNSPHSTCEACDPRRSTRAFSDLPAGTQCGDRFGSTCEGTGLCDGAGTCLEDPLPAGSPCFDDGNPCTIDACDGAGGCSHLPGNPGVVCRAGTGECDPEERCSGTSVACPPDAAVGAGSPCTDDGNPCTVDACDGASACRHTAGNAGVVCRAGSGDRCDPDERCDGTSPACPSDVVEPAASVCRPPTSACDLPERCIGVARAVCPPDAVVPDGATCDAGDDAPRARICVAGACAPCCPDAQAAPRFVANGDGSVTDRSTCLVWEMKNGGDGLADGTNPHDVDNRYPRSGGDSTAAFLAALRLEEFAGHADWRLASSAGCCGLGTGEVAELESILRSPCPGNGASCAEPAIGPTAAGSYWSSSSAGSLGWRVSFLDGVAATASLAEPLFVRAVRGADTCGDQVQDCGETDVDCGGPCRPCADGGRCDDGSDCRSAVCGADGRCAAPSCTDGAENGDETDVDCGGSTCAACLAGQGCSADGDCASRSCDPQTRTCDACFAAGGGPCDGDASCCAGLQCAEGSRQCVTCLPAGDSVCTTASDCCGSLRCVQRGTNAGKCVTCLSTGDGICSRNLDCCPGRTCVSGQCR